MKKKTILLAILLCTISPAAQSQLLIGLLFGDRLNNDQMEFGFNVSTNMSSVTATEGGTFTWNLSLGLFLDFKLTDRWIFSPSFLFTSGKGVRNFGLTDQFYPLPDTIHGSSNSERFFRYFELPLLMSFRPTKKIGFGLGLDAGYMIMAEDIYSVDTDISSINITHNIKDFTNRFEFGVMVGMHYHFKGDPGTQIRVNYIHGLTNVYRKETGRKGYNRTFQLGVMIPIKFGVSKIKEEIQDQ